MEDIFDAVLKNPDKIFDKLKFVSPPNLNQDLITYIKIIYEKCEVDYSKINFRIDLTLLLAGLIYERLVKTVNNFNDEKKLDLIEIINDWTIDVYYKEYYKNNEKIKDTLLFNSPNLYITVWLNYSNGIYSISFEFCRFLLDINLLPCVF